MIAFTFAVPAHGHDLRVGPGQPFVTLQDAVDAAAAGDRLLLFPGTYEPVVVTRDLELVGLGGPDLTAIAAGPGPAVQVTDAQVTLRGLTLDGLGLDRGVWARGALVVLEDAALTGGWTSGDGGCLWLEAGDVQLVRTRVEGCAAEGSGGGVAVRYASLQLTGSTVAGCTAGTDGGGVHLWNGSTEVVGTTFVANVADDLGGYEGSGGGLYAEAADVDVLGSRFSANTASSIGVTAGKGGGAWFTSTGAAIAGSVLEDNVATESGGAIALTDASLVLTGSRLRRNQVTDPVDDVFGGGAVYCQAPTLCDIDRSWFDDNVAPDGGAICSTGELLLTSSTLCGNHRTNDAGALDVGNLEPYSPVLVAGNLFALNDALVEGGAAVVTGGDVRLVNNHWVGNTGAAGGAIKAITISVAAGLDLRSNLVAGNSGGQAVVELAGVPATEGWGWFWSNTPADFDLTVPGSGTVVGLDPLLTGPIASCDPADLVPAPGSPLIDAGDPTTLDEDGSVADIGVFGGG